MQGSRFLSYLCINKSKLNEMEKITILNINNKEFKFTESAYLLLSDYNKFLKRTIKEKDRLSDIEIQISVLLEMENENSKKDSLVTTEIMQEVISILKENQKIDYKAGKFKQKKQNYKRKKIRHSEIKRDTKNNVLGGVCSGIANRFNIDPVFVRVLFVAASFVFGIFAVLYVILWVVLPEKELTYIRTV